MAGVRTAGSAGRRAAVVTGASSGIGLACTRALVEDGFAVTMLARRPDKLAHAAAELRAAGADVLDDAVNVGDADALIAAFDRHRQEFGRLDVLVNNAGVGIVADPWQLSLARVDLLLDVNLRSIIVAYAVTLDLLLAAVEESGGAYVFNVASILSHYPRPDMAVYSATKAAIVNYTASMNGLLASRGIRSTALCPGFVASAMTEPVGDEHPLDEMIPAEDVAEMMRAVMRLSSRTMIPEIPMMRPGAAPSGL